MVWIILIILYEPQKDDQYELFLNDFSDYDNIDNINPFGREPSPRNYYVGPYEEVEYNEKFETYGEEAGWPKIFPAIPTIPILTGTNSPISKK